MRQNRKRFVITQVLSVEINISTRVPWSVVLFNFLDIAIVTQIVELWLEVRKERVLVSQMPKVIQRLTNE